jgi:hypothetical protein
VLYFASEDNLPAPAGRIEACVTIDEELNVLEDALRRLKIEYDVYFGGGSKRPPNDLEWRVQSLVKKHSDTGKLNFQQRFRYNSLAQKYAIFSDLWRQKMKVKEEGYRRPSDAMLGIQGLRTESALEAVETASTPEAFSIRCGEKMPNSEQVRSLYEAMMQARKAAGEGASAGSIESFTKFVRTKTAQIRQEMKCESVEFSVEVEQGRVKLKARAAE